MSERVKERPFSRAYLQKLWCWLGANAPADSKITRLFRDLIDQFIDTIDDLVNHERLLQEAEAEQERLKRTLEFHPRAAKLMGKKKNFLVVADDEPYFMEVYNKIREEEQRKGRWTDEDEYNYDVATGRWLP